MIDYDTTREVYLATGRLRDVAAKFGVSERTLARMRARDRRLDGALRRARREIRKARVPEHGTYPRYRGSTQRKGCRCRKCREANAAKHRRLYQARKQATGYGRRRSA